MRPTIMTPNPYDSPVTSSDLSVARSSFSLVAKIALCILGLAMFATNPWRDLKFYEDIAAHEGFGTTADSYIIGVAGQVMATVFLLPVALFLIIFGIARSTRFSIRPRFDRFTWGWGIVASLLALLMLLIESDYILYGIRHAHHLDTVLVSLAYLAFIYIWWCCSLAHGKDSRARRSRGERTGRVRPPDIP